MKKLLLLFLFSITVGFSQEKLTITKEGVKPIVVEVPGKSAAELYSKTKEWINTYYRSPKDVLKGDIENDLIRIEGFVKDGFKTKSLGMVFSYDYDYTLEISFKDGKYKFDYIVGRLWTDGKRLMYDYDTFFKKDGSVRTLYQLSYDSMNESINETSTSLFEYLSGKTAEKKKDW